MRLAILGGSFNPVHKGHLALAEAALAEGYERVILTPALRSPFKLEAAEADEERLRAEAQTRVELILAAISGDRRFTVDDCEIRRGGVSYTIDTVADIGERYLPEGKLGLVLGDDLAEGFARWKSAAELASRVDLLVANRTGDVLPYPHKRLANPVLTVSSSELRALIRSGSRWEEAVPPQAAALIRSRALYGAKAAPALAGVPLPSRGFLAETEDRVRDLLPQGRFLHSRSTALLSSDIASRLGLDADGAYLAGITHDVCKPLSDAQLLELASADGYPIQAFEREKPGLLHGRAAAVLLEREFAINDPAVLEAVRWHTTGHPGMGPLAKIVYSADKIEYRRNTVASRLRLAAREGSLDTLFPVILRGTVDYLAGRGIAITEDTQRLLEEERGHA